MSISCIDVGGFPSPSYDSSVVGQYYEGFYLNIRTGSNEQKRGER